MKPLSVRHSAGEPHPLLNLLEQHHQTLLRLVTTIQELWLARDLETVMHLVRREARAEEDAISPLWKGRRFPIQSCISGWAMLNRHAAIIEDIYADPRLMQCGKP